MVLQTQTNLISVWDPPLTSLAALGRSLRDEETNMDPPRISWRSRGSACSQLLFESWLCHFLAVWPWERPISSLCLYVLVYGIGC